MHNSNIFYLATVVTVILLNTTADKSSFDLTWRPNVENICIDSPCFNIDKNDWSAFTKKFDNTDRIHQVDRLLEYNNDTGNNLNHGSMMLFTWD